jgi:purine catabolism regulator
MTSELSKGITVRELSAMPQLRMRVLAGHGGVDRPISWAHVVDHASPWDWLEPADLVLTTGAIIPGRPDAQVEFIEKMVDAGLSGLVVGDDYTHFTDAILATADRLDFPVLSVHPQTSWVELSRLVVRANHGPEGRTVSTIMRIHDAVRSGLQSARSSAQFLEALGDVVGCELKLFESDMWEPVFPGTTAPDLLWRDEMSQHLRDRRGAAIRFASLKAEARESLAVPVPIERPIYLLAENWRGEAPRLTLLEHAAAACAMELALVDARFDEGWRMGWSLLSQALQGELDPAALGIALNRRGIEPPYVCVAIEASSQSADRVSRYWRVRNIPHLVTRMSSVMVLLHADGDRRGDLETLSGMTTLRAGISDPFVRLSALPDAGRQARWALETVALDESGVSAYAAAGPTLLPRTLLESEHIVDLVLGPLLRYDEESGSDMVHTLSTYLECDRSPKRTAEELFVHTQTVHYRLQRIQQLTGRSLSGTSDISAFWLAVQTLNVLQTGTQRSAEPG